MAPSRHVDLFSDAGVSREAVTENKQGVLDFEFSQLSVFVYFVVVLLMTRKGEVRLRTTYVKPFMIGLEWKKHLLLLIPTETIEVRTRLRRDAFVLLITSSKVLHRRRMTYKLR